MLPSPSGQTAHGASGWSSRTHLLKSRFIWLNERVIISFCGFAQGGRALNGSKRLAGGVGWVIMELPRRRGC
jgi:hypothetical protein